jgi:hypothetical protein
MRLIRITDADGDGRFDGTINADVVVEEGSKMCIESLALEIYESEIEVVKGANKVTYTQGATNYVADLGTTVYSTNQGDALLADLENEFNRSASYYPENAAPQSAQIIGMDYRAAVNATGKVGIEARKGTVGELPDSDWESSSGINKPPVVAPAQIYWGVNEAVADGNCRVAQVSRAAIPAGNAYLEATIYNAVTGGVATNPERNGVWLCYTSEDLNELPVEQLRQELETPAGRIKYCRYGVGISINAGNQVQAISIENGLVSTLGLPTTTAVTPGTISNPRIRLTRSDGGIVASSWNVDVPVAVSETLTAFEELEPTEDLYQFVVFWDRDNYIEVSQVQGCLSPYANAKIATYVKEEDADVGLGAPAIRTIYLQPQGYDATYNKYQPDYTPTANYLTFETDALASFLGFRAKRTPLTGSRTGINFVANAVFRYGPRLLSDTIIVLSETVPLVSYDTTRTNQDGQGQQRSILAVVPVSPANTGSVSYRGRETWLDVHNNQPLTFRNLRFRLVTGDYVPMRIFGQASLTILIRGPHEV